MPPFPLNPTIVVINAFLYPQNQAMTGSSESRERMRLLCQFCHNLSVPVKPGRNLYYVLALFSAPLMSNFRTFFVLFYLQSANWVMLNLPMTFCFDLILISMFLEVFTYRDVICITSLQWTM
jgi:hypothetical protein